MNLRPDASCRGDISCRHDGSYCQDTFCRRDIFRCRDIIRRGVSRSWEQVWWRYIRKEETVVYLGVRCEITA
jgi:hypothetical protein